MIIFLAPLLLLLLLLLLLASDATSASTPVATSEACTLPEDVVLGCDNDDTFSVTYPAGTIECGFALTLDQSALEPTLTLLAAPDDETTYYTIMLVDTADSPFHPILHYGASNIPVESLLQSEDFVLSSVDTFESYRGPSPPAFIPGIQEQLFNYEWIVAPQSSFVEELPEVPSNTRFDYNAYLASVDATIFATSYLSAGFCVTALLDPPAPPPVSSAPVTPAPVSLFDPAPVTTAPITTAAPVMATPTTVAPVVATLSPVTMTPTTVAPVEATLSPVTTTKNAKKGRKEKNKRPKEKHYPKKEKMQRRLTRDI